ncbi:hypothetical protein HPB52_013897 [Rhipicephalus sanguineus]|uniref:Uncharacterized protein n=1 Tax=Rhipicephalus sanguineus TaxID=34632 RepID=A0A9D4TA70_RHISA|nr:hypothetical protein HPB52_013897 [Rhipicephalus sanguineus]
MVSEDRHAARLSTPCCVMGGVASSPTHFFPERCRNSWFTCITAGDGRVPAAWPEISPGSTSSKYSDRFCLFSEFKMSVVDVGTYEIVYDRMLLAVFGACGPVGDVFLIFLFRRQLDTTVKSLSEAISSVEEPSEVSMWTTLGPKSSLVSEAE